MKLLPSLSSDLAGWVQRQPVFFTGSASTHGRHINVSPKGLADSHFAVLSPSRCAYIDRTGSGCETIAHAYENGRLCLMFMSFGDTPRILRLFCNSHVVEWDQPQFETLVATVAHGKRDAFDGARAVIVCDIWQVQTSCGYGVPRVKKGLYAPNEDARLPVDDILRRGGVDGDAKLSELSVFEARPTLDKWADGLVEANKLLPYQNEKNLYSLDGLPGLRSARRNAGQPAWLVHLRTWSRRILAERDAVAIGFSLATFFFFILSHFGYL